MTRGGAMLFSICLAMTMAACGPTAPSRFYTLGSTATPGAPLANPSPIMIGSVSVPASVDQPQFVVQVAPDGGEIAGVNSIAGRRRCRIASRAQ